MEKGPFWVKIQNFSKIEGSWPKGRGDPKDAFLDAPAQETLRFPKKAD